MNFNLKLKNLISELFKFRFKPGRDTLMALATLFIFWPIYYLGSGPLSDEFIGLFLFMIVGNLFLNVLIPAYYVVEIRKEPISNLGLKREGWLPALIGSIVLAAFFIFELFEVAEGIAMGVIIPHVIANGLILWEPFFVFGWLQNRYERAFGTLPAILMAAASFGLYHVGTYPLEGVLSLAGFALFFAAIYKLFNHNLLVLWPLTWAVSSSIGTLEEFLFEWSQVFSWGVILLITAAGLWWFAAKNK